MTENEERIYLLEELLNESDEFRDIHIPSKVEDQKVLLRSLMNIRQPRTISSRFLQIQDDYLQQQLSHEEITDVNSLKPVSRDPRIYIWQGDITTLKIDAIVNAANNQMCGCFIPMHACIDNIIHSKSGIELRLYCANMMHKQWHLEPIGSAKITPAFNLPSKYILHTVGPIIYDRVHKKDEELLKSCYKECLKLADENNIKSIAFCCISTGEFHFPNELAANIAINTVKEYLEKTNIEKVVFNVFKNIDKKLYEQILESK